MHQAGLSLGGHFTPANIPVYTSQTLSVRLTGVHFTRFTQVNGYIDYDQLVTCVEEMFSLREWVPPAIEAWLDLIQDGVTGHEYLIRYNVALMDPAQAFQWLMEARGILEQLRFRDPRTFQLILGMHPEMDDWDSNSYCLNTLLAQTRGFIDRRDPTQQPTVFEHDVTGVLTVCRNSSQHASRFLERFMVLILEFDFPALLF
ncbi:hypothetical protein CFC21_097502 [Triticum aestivum]|uniref:Uncharacterized protein n=2 Tax=Triticum aestivum TaxID=4565 RepID=A0A3B6RHU2_WHEAT|nr:hypothetical protein CFC21_097502 [Triticum aestivum]